MQRIAGTDQIIQAISADLTSPESSAAALTRAAERHGGRCPEHLYLCAGFSQPQFFIDASAKQLQEVRFQGDLAVLRRGGLPGEAFWALQGQ